MTRYDRILSGAGLWCAFYRANPHRFAKDYLHLDLHLFQKILIVMMNLSTVVTFIGARGIGKTFLSAVFCVIRCILYPGTKICIASGTRGQAINVLEKIMLELKPGSRELAAEIDEKQTKINGTNAQIVFKNGSYIKVVTASDSARGNRANILLIDEFRMVNKDTIDTVLRKFLTQKRRPAYSRLSKQDAKAERAKEKNMTMYLSSAYFKDHWSYTKCTDTCKMMLDDTRHQFVCGLPYQLSVTEGLLDEATVEEEMLEADFNEIKFSMEYSALWWGGTEGSFFDFNTVAKNRKIIFPMLPDKLSMKIPSCQELRIPQKVAGECRILSADIALMASKKHRNDATSIFITQLMPTKSGRYVCNVVFSANAEGMHTEDQALMIRKMYDEYRCDYIVLDANGVGLGVYDQLVRDMTDGDTGEIYPALSCCNDQAMADRCTVPGAEKVIWSVKANTTFNSQCATLLREGFRSGKIRLLATEYDTEMRLNEFKEFQRLTEYERAQIVLPCVHTTLLIDELVKLQHEDSKGNNQVKVYERSGNRKDRYSSLSYNYYVAAQLESKLIRKSNAVVSTNDVFVFRPPKFSLNNRR